MDNNIFYFLIFYLTAYTAIAVPLVADFEYPQLFNDKDENGVPGTIKTQSDVDVHIMNNPVDSNRYFLFTRRNKYIPQPLEINNVESILSSNFNAERPTVFIAHGAMGNHLMEPNRIIKSAYLDKSDVNIISMAWTRANGGLADIGRRVGQFLNFLNKETGASLSDMHLIGFSAGAHVVGNAGRELGGQIARITGLDPGGPSWATNNYRLNASDGIYVEAIHTDGAGMGVGTAIADVDFFPNGGVSQPGCSTSLCRHYRAGQFFAATVTYNHLQGRLCTSTSQIKSDTCGGPTLNMGNDDLNKRGSGMYRVNTASRYPY